MKLIILLSTLLLSACNNSSTDETSITAALADSFNLSALSAVNSSYDDGSGTVRQLQLTWETAAQDDNASDLDYTICQTDTSQENNCEVLAEVSDVLTTTIELNSLIDALSKNFFIIANNGEDSVSSSEASLTTDTVTDMIGYFKAENAEDNDVFGYKVAISADGYTFAVGAHQEDSDSIDDTTNNDASKSGAVYVFSYNQTTTRWSQSAYLKAESPTASDNFGKNLALSADGLTLAVGTHSDDSDATGIDGDTTDGTATTSGAVYIFSNNDDTWSQTAYIKASNAEKSDQFGTSLALNSDGTTLAVSAPYEDSAATGIDGEQTETDDTMVSSSGAVYIFDNNGTWSQTAYIKASNAEKNDFFGKAVALNEQGDTLIVSAWGEDSSSDDDETDNEASSSGAAYIFNNVDSSWEQTAYLKASNVEASDGFGYTVSMNNAGTLVSVSSFSEDSSATGIDGDESNNDETTSGAVYLFAYDGSDWSQSAYIKASNTETNDRFGFYTAELSGDGNTLAVGASEEDSAATGINGEQTETDDTEASASGAAYLYSYLNDTWTQTAYVKASNTTESDKFGISVALSEDGNTLIVGSSGEDSAATTINGNQFSTEDELDDNYDVVTSGTNYSSNSGAVYLY